jgi:N-acetylglucosaminyldiphosphoundecaprenol N-acetyl-beta-D-mannosaminyltransferase
MDSSATASIDYAPRYAPRSLPPRTVALMGLDVAAVSERDTIDFVLDALEGHRGGWICPANLDVLRQWHGSAQVRELVAAADLVVADGMPLVWAGEIQGSPLPERVAGSSLIVSLTAAAADAGASIFLLGGNPGTAEAAVAKLSRLAPELRLAGTMCPPFGFEHDPAWLDRIERELHKQQPDIVYVGLGFPKQERLICALRERLPYTWFVSCGISFSFVAGEITRAPAVMQRLGLEWLHRMTQEPGRLYRRYLLLGIPFLVQLMSSALVFRLRHAARGAP